MKYMNHDNIASALIQNSDFIKQNCVQILFIHTVETMT